MAQVIGLGHVGIYVRDLQRMVTFYRDTLGLRVTKQNWRAGIVFLSADPEGADHEIALFRGRPDDVDSRLINQISLRVATLDDLRTFHRRLIAAGLRIDALVNHVSALGCYYFDPESNRERAGVATVGLNDGKADAFRRTQHRYPSFTEPTPLREMSPTLDLVLFQPFNKPALLDLI